MREAELPASGFTALHVDFGIVDIAFSLPLPQFEAEVGLAAGVAVQQAGEADVAAAAAAVVVVHFGAAGYGLMVAVVVVVPAPQPVAERHRVMKGITAGMAVDGLPARAARMVFVSEIVVEGGVEQVAQPQRVVGGEGEAALVFAGGLAAGVVHIDAEPVGNCPLAPRHHDVALIRLFGGHNLNIGFRSGKPFQVLQTLFQVSEVQYCAATGGKLVGEGGDAPDMGGIGLSSFKPDLPDASGQYGQNQYPAVQVLRGGQNAGGGVAATDQRVLRQHHNAVDALCTQTLPGHETGLGNGLPEGKRKLTGRIAGKLNLPNPKARCFRRGRMSRTRGNSNTGTGSFVQPHIRIRLQLLLHILLMLLFALDLL